MRLTVTWMSSWSCAQERGGCSLSLTWAWPSRDNKGKGDMICKMTRKMRRVRIWGRFCYTLTHGCPPFSNIFIGNKYHIIIKFMNYYILYLLYTLTTFTTSHDQCPARCMLFSHSLINEYIIVVIITYDLFIIIIIYYYLLLFITIFYYYYAIYYFLLWFIMIYYDLLQFITIYYNLLQFITIYYNLLQFIIDYKPKYLLPISRPSLIPSHCHALKVCSLSNPSTDLPKPHQEWRQTCQSVKTIPQGGGWIASSILVWHLTSLSPELDMKGCHSYCYWCR